MQPQIRSAGCFAKCDMKTHHLPVKKTTEGKIGLKAPGVWCIPCGCGEVYVIQAQFGNPMQGTHEAPFPGPAREFGSSRTYHGYQTA